MLQTCFEPILAVLSLMGPQVFRLTAMLARRSYSYTRVRTLFCGSCMRKALDILVLTGMLVDRHLHAHAVAVAALQADLVPPLPSQAINVQTAKHLLLRHVS
jgi:hypothetical protein